MNIHDTVMALKRAAGKADVIYGILWRIREVSETEVSGSDELGGSDESSRCDACDRDGFGLRGRCL
ncbi:MAG TPA: hypothetical protein VN689_12930, partial [Burkholderiales bacterium]|nr:hypothetical protein [Burkholderiales bacterium]